jgi:DNA-directed RNA polymerase specialized sigma24 family protein
VLRALCALPRRQQVAVVLRHYCDLSELETAAVMGISVGGVKSQSSKGLAALRITLAPSQTSEESTHESQP